MAKNTHLEHLEDDIVNSGKTGGFNAINFLRELGKMLTQPSGGGLTITTKWDGAPAVVCGTDPVNGMFFVGTKSVFNKTAPKLGFNHEMIDYHYPNPGLNKLLKICFDHLINIGITGVLQGDLLFTSDDKKSTTINGESVISFQPNTIVYTVPVNSDLGNKINKAKVGIVFHTKYTGTAIQDLTASFGVDISNLNKIDDVYCASATFTDTGNVAKFDTMEKSKYDTLVNKSEGSLKQSSAFLNEIKDYGEGKFMMNAMFKQYMNSIIRSGAEIKNVTATATSFENFYFNQLTKEIDSKKTKSAKDKYLKIQTDGMQFLKTNSRSLYFTIASYMNIIEAKTFVIRKLEMVKTLGTFLKTDNGYQVTAPEGFVAIKSGGALKLVDRLEFSRANFTAAKNWDKG